MKQYGVPILPGSEGIIASAEEAREWARRTLADEMARAVGPDGKVMGVEGSGLEDAADVAEFNAMLERYKAGDKLIAEAEELSWMSETISR